MQNDLQQTTPLWIALFRGCDKAGVRQDKWKLLTEKPLSNIAAAKQECQLFFESDLLWAPAEVEFRVCTTDERNWQCAAPPHGAALSWTELSTPDS